MVEDRTRHERLRSLLPGGYATNPRDSALGVLLDVLADRLRETDQALERGLRDKWLRTAEAEREPQLTEEPPEVPPAAAEAETEAETETEAAAAAEVETETEPLPRVKLSDHPRPLEYLGATLDLLRQPLEADVEAYRRRVRILAPLLVEGLGTPRAILAMALSALGSEPCPVLEREGNETRGFGMPSGSLDRCRTCRGGHRPLPGTPCPLRAENTMSASVIDNPRRRVELVRQQVRPHSSRARIHLNNLSLFADRPELTLSIPSSATGVEVVPRLRSVTTGEELVVARVLGAGDTLVLRGPSPHDPNEPEQRQRWVDRPPAFAIAPAQARVGSELDVPVILSQGSRFDAAVFGPELGPSTTAGTFAVTRLVNSEEESPLEVPAVMPGANTWVYEAIDRTELGLLIDDLTGTDIGTLPELTDVPATADETQVSLVLRWWVRAPARFLLRIPLEPAVQAALDAGAVDYLRRLVDRARPVGVLPVIDFPPPVFTEDLEPLDRITGLDVVAVEALAPVDVLVSPSIPVEGEVLTPEDGAAFIGVFDVTLFDFSLFSEAGP